MISILPLAASVWTGLIEMINNVTNEYLGDFVSIAVVLAAMLAAFSIVKTTSSYIEGSDKFAWDIVRPIIILLCVQNFSDICYAFDSLVASITTKIIGSADCTMSDFLQVFKEGVTTTEATWLDNIKKVWNGQDGPFVKMFNTAWTALRDGFAAVISTKNICTLGAIAGIGRFLSELIFLVMEILAAAYLILMRLFGPFIVAMAIPGIWRNNIPSLISRYIQVSLWTPVGFICFAIINASTKQLVNMIGSLSYGHDFGTIFYGLAIVVVSISLIGTIPKICSWIVESSGTAGAQDGVISSMKSAPKAAVKAVTGLK